MDTIISTLQTAWFIFLVIMFFNLMIFVHELGHFLAGKWRGAYIDRFQIWFGKPIWSKEIGGVRWGIGWIPAGGFVSLPQMEDMESIEGKVTDRPKNLKPLKALDKVIIAAAGPLFSLLLAYVFALVVWGVGKPSTEMQGTSIGLVPSGTPASAAGLLPGDVIRAIDGQPVTKWVGNMAGVRELIAMSENKTIEFTIDRPIKNSAQQEKFAGESQTTLDSNTLAESNDPASHIPAPEQNMQRLVIHSTFTQPERQWWQRSGLRQVGILPAIPSIVGDIIPASPADKAELKKGDIILSVNGQNVYTPLSISDIASTGEPMKIGIRRKSDNSDSLRELTITPEIPYNWQGKEGACPILGFNWGNPYGEIQLEHPTPQQQVSQSIKWMKDTFEKVCSPGSSIGMEHLSGPVGIGSYMYRMMEEGNGMGWRLILWFAVVLNVNLAILNILPLPVVDGGHVVLGLVQMIIRKPVNSKCLDWVMTYFIFVLLAFFLFVTFKDIGDLIGGRDDGKENKLPPPVFRPADQ